MKHGYNRFMSYFIDQDGMNWFRESHATGLTSCHITAPAASQIAILCWANVGFSLYTLLGHRWKMTLAPRNFAHRPNVIPTRWPNICFQTF